MALNIDSAIVGKLYILSIYETERENRRKRRKRRLVASPYCRT